jgi:hypothetical protein
MSEDEEVSFIEQFKAIEQWIETENTRTLSTTADLELYESQLLKIKEYGHALDVLREREEAGSLLRTEYEEIAKSMENIRLNQLVLVDLDRTSGRGESWGCSATGCRTVSRRCRLSTGKDTTSLSKVWPSRVTKSYASSSAPDA